MIASASSVAASRSSGYFLGQVAHRGDICLIERAAILRRFLRIALRERLDERLLLCARPRRELPGLGQRFPRPGRVFRLHGRIDVRAEHEGLAPVRHRALGIEPRRFRERPACFLVVERIGEDQPLVEEALGLARLAGDLKVVTAQPPKQRRDRLRGLRRLREQRCRAAEGKSEECDACFSESHD
jgi:hypothetical protein